LPVELESSAFAAWVESVEGVEIKRLFAVYNFAERTAPENFLGVERITYAENALIRAQDNV
jgi:hypothetical protein